MNDEIVARLREGTSGSDIAKTDPYLNSLMQKSADEIERLRVDNQRVGDLQKALNLALRYLFAHEPGDSRAVSDEFVAMCAVSSNCVNEQCRQIIERALAREKTND